MQETLIRPSSQRVWDLIPGEVFRGRTIVAVRGEVGLASNPVAVISFAEDDPRPSRIPAAHSEFIQYCDEVATRARHWVRNHGLREGDAVDLASLRLDVTNPFTP